MLLIKGETVADYSFSRPDLLVLKAAGYSGVIRYVGWSPQSVDQGDKIISTQEADRIYAAGLGLALVFQTGKYRPTDGAPGGYVDAETAIAHANHLGYRGVLFAAIDYDTALTDLVYQYLYNFHVTVKRAGFKSGVYGGVRIVRAVATEIQMDYYWQTIAWSYGEIADEAHIHQQTQFQLGGGTIDHNEILAAIPFYHPTITPKIAIRSATHKKATKMFLVQLLSQQIILTDGLTAFRLLFDDGTEFKFQSEVLGLPIFSVTDPHVDNFYRNAAGLPMNPVA